VRLQVAVLADYARCGPGDVRALDAAVESLGEETDPTRIERVATAALFLDRATACRGALWRVVEDGRRGGAVASAITALQVLCLDDVMTGQWEEALRLAREGVALSAEHGYALLGWPFRLAQGVVAAARGLDVELRATVDEMDAWAAPRRARSWVHFARQCAGLAALARGDADAAYRELEVVAAPGTLPFGVPGALWAALDVVEAAAHSGRAEEARAHVEALYDAGIPALSPHLAMLSGAARALVVPEPEATAAFEAAVTVPGAARWPFDLARVQLLQGEHLRRVRRGTPARAPLVAALATFRRLRADPWAARTAAALRATGEPVVPSPESSPAAELTPQEREVALLAASGLTNKQIGERLYLSHRTVGSHLHRIFPKLGITTRAALRDALAPVPADGGQDRTGGAGDSRGPAAGT
jgi:DNA-binding CsgD family transcriptional regulator